MGDQHDGLAAAAQVVERGDQRLFADVVEVGVGFVQHDQRGVVVHRARQADTLFLPARQSGTAVAEQGVVALREMQDHVMHAGAPGRRDHFFGIDFAEARDVVADRSGEQFDILRQVADAGAELVLVPVIDIRAVQPHLADRGRPDADQQPRQGGFARAARADDAQHVARRNRKVQVFQHRHRRAGRRRRDRFHRNLAERFLQRHAGLARRIFGEQLVQALVGAACAAPAFPDADQLFDRTQRPAHQDRGDDHHAGGDLVFQHQQGAVTKNQRLQGYPHELGQRADDAGLFAGFRLQLQEAAVQLEPARHQVGQHAHRFDHFRIAQVVGGQVAGFDRHRVGFRQGLFRHGFVDVGQHDQHGRTAQREDAQRGVEHEDDRQVDRKPRHVEEGEYAVTGQELADIGQVAQGLPGIAAGLLQVLLESRRINPLVHFHVELRADPHQHKTAHQLQRAHAQIGRQHHQGQHQQRGLVAAGQHAVVNLQHVQRRHQHDQVDNGAEHTD